MTKAINPGGINGSTTAGIHRRNDGRTPGPKLDPAIQGAMRKQANQKAQALHDAIAAARRTPQDPAIANAIAAAKAARAAQAAAEAKALKDAANTPLDAPIQAVVDASNHAKAFRDFTISANRAGMAHNTVSTDQLQASWAGLSGADKATALTGLKASLMRRAAVLKDESVVLDARQTALDARKQGIADRMAALETLRAQVNASGDIDPVQEQSLQHQETTITNAANTLANEYHDLNTRREALDRHIGRLTDQAQLVSQFEQDPALAGVDTTPKAPTPTAVAQ